MTGKPMYLNISLNAKLMPKHRHDLEDALDEKLKGLGYSIELTGGGTAMEGNGEVASSDIELEVKQCTAEKIKAAIEVLEGILAPVGSKIVVSAENENDEAEVISFGVQEGLGLYFNGKDLPEEVYKECNINFVYEEIQRLLADSQAGQLASYCEAPVTAFYLYGKSYEEMLKVIKPTIDEYPLCQKCRVVQIA